MLNLIKTDMKILVHKKGFQLTLLLLIVYCVAITLMYADAQKGSDISMLYHPAILSGLNSDMDYVWFFCRWYPFLVILPAGFCVINDKKTNMGVFIKYRSGRLKYYVSKLVSAFLITFIAFVVPFLMQLCLNLVTFTGEPTRIMTNWATYSEVYFDQSQDYLLSGLFTENVYLYFLCSLALTGVFSGCLAVFLVGISTFGVKYKAFMFLPVYLVLYLATCSQEYFEGVVTHMDFYITMYDAVGNKSLAFYIMFMVVLLVVGILCTIRNLRSKGNIN